MTLLHIIFIGAIFVEISIAHGIFLFLRFAGSMRREDAHNKLVLLPDGSFIVRRNPENGQYALSVRYS